ncbi:hypothetical protein [Bacillus alkalicellulosilyticus]|uniref:hypothetical protein n=1 Tax=Alkalihalobacterium alkalicellulosilyticum TaxID=1912214 RepID=UPI000998103C|nr:hypothetical protein [Bacillus alkalicellulosilyticus]
MVAEMIVDILVLWVVVEISFLFLLAVVTNNVNSFQTECRHIRMLQKTSISEAILALPLLMTRKITFMKRKIPGLRDRVHDCDEEDSSCLLFT